MGVLRVELGLLASVALANRVDPVRIAEAVLANRAGCWAVLVLVRGDLGGSTEILDSVDGTKLSLPALLCNEPSSQQVLARKCK